MGQEPFKGDQRVPMKSPLARGEQALIRALLPHIPRWIEGWNGGAAHPRDPPARSWAALMRRVFGFDVLACPRCGRAMRLIALIEQPDVIRRILRHLGEATEVPPPAPARSPPLAFKDADGPTGWSEEPDVVTRGVLEPAADGPC